MKKKVLSLKKHQEVLYDILYALDDFCEKNNIQYFLGYGSLLGAIRHHGIIPWDDDADVMMERKEYERFQKLIIKNPPTGFQAYSIYNTPNYYYPFIKFGKKNTLLEEPLDYMANERMEMNINIDIFPLDGCPGETREQAGLYAVTFFPRYLSILREWFNPPQWHKLISIKEKVYYLLHLPCRISVFRKMFFKHLFKDATRYSCKETKFYSCISWSFNGARNVHACSFMQTIYRVPFGKRSLPIPSGYDIILQEEYGDYMTPPDEKGKMSTHEFGNVYIFEE